MGLTYAYAAEIVKSERDADGHLIVYGKATGPDLDLDGQICDPKWLKKAMPEWMTFGNIREMHGPIAAGIGIELTEKGDDWFLKSKCIDPGTATKIEEGVLKGYSIGIKNGQVTKDASAPGGRIVGGVIVETSYVDRPCNPTAKMTIAKRAGAGDAFEGVESDAAQPAGDDSADTPQAVAVEPAKDGDGTVPGSSSADVIAADPEEGAPEDAAESAEKSLARGVGRTILAGLKALKTKTGQPLITKAAPSDDIASAEACMSAIGALIGQEAQGLVDGMTCEAYQIECLLRAYNSLQYFCALEATEPADDEAANVEVIVLDAQPTITKTTDTEPVKATETTATPDGDQSAEVSGLKERVKTLEAQLTKVLDRPVPGGPVLARQVPDIDKADSRAALLAKAAEYDRLALNMAGTDSAAAKGYRELATAARSSL
jgi:hypothetical protein